MKLDVFACPLHGSALIEASAGTGKTWAICGLVLRLVAEQGLAIDQVLVVTFTNAATAELKERIRDRLLAALRAVTGESANDSDPFITALLARLDDAGISHDTARARLQAALAAFDEAAIHTIHGFCQRALADMPFASGQPFALELADNAALCREVAADFWRRHIAHGQLSPAIADWLGRGKLLPETLAGLLARHLARPLAEVRWPEMPTNHPDPDALRRTFLAAAALWHSAGETARATLHAALPGLPANVHSAAKVDLGGEAWSAYFNGGDPGAKLGDYAANYRTAKLKAKKGHSTPEHPFFAAAEALCAEQEALAAAGEMAKLRLLQTLLAEGLPALKQKKHERRQQAFDDLLSQLHAALTGARGEALASGLRQRYPAALIDEFQDTDPLQFAIFQRIYSASDAPLFLVGDPKQAIYSFRQADLNTYLKARQQVSSRYTLAANQRSDAALISAVNAVFAGNPQAFMQGGLDFSPADVGDKPRAPFADSSSPAAALHCWQLPTDTPLSKAQALAQAAQATAEEIARLLHAANAGAICRAGQAVRASDIAVLVRTHAQGKRIKAALAAVGLPAAELSPESIFASGDALEIERLLLALAEPARPDRLKTALATSLFGLNGAELLALQEDEVALADWISRFSAWRELWQAHGISRALTQIFAEAGITARLLAGADGERRLTNQRHLGELLHSAAAQHPGMEALLAWLAAQRSDGNGDETAQLRLDSDRQLVSIVTIHKAKGLQYPLVFCPFVFEGGIRRQSSRLPGKEYPAANGQRMIDYGEGETGFEARLKQEHAAEQIRLLYVALTRAEHRLTLVCGPYLTGSANSDSESRKGLLNWLIAGAGSSAEDWLKNGEKEEIITAAWQGFAASATVHLTPLPAPNGLRAPPAANHLQLAAASFPRSLRPDWRLDSFTGLLRDATLPEAAASDHDAHQVSDSLEPTVLAAPASPAPPTPASDILRFPRGAQAGDCIHAVFERVDFADPHTWPSAIASSLKAFPPGGKASEQALTAMLQSMLHAVCHTPLLDAWQLADVPRQRCRAELEFTLPAAGLNPATLGKIAAAHGIALPLLNFRPLHGWLRGFIDLVFEHDGRYYILDWKSNHLGHSPADYTAAPLAAAMFEHGYALQALLYQLALHRHLARRLPDYDPARHLGGALYLFIRGVRPDWPGAGIHHQPANLTLLNEISSLIAP